MAADASRPKFSIIRTMKRPGLTPLLPSATLFLALIASGLPAADQPAAKPAETATDTIKRFDQDGDGMLDDAERAEAKAYFLRNPSAAPKSQTKTEAGGEGKGMDEMRGRVMQMFDRNKDGRLDEAERAEAQKFAAENGLGRADMRGELVKRFDKNGNGILDPEERGPAMEFARKRMDAAAPAAKSKTAAKPKVASRVDTKTEAGLEGVLRTAMEKDAAQRRRFDIDNNGKLDDSEWAAARHEIQQWANQHAVVGNPTPLEEQKRLESVANEVTRRREMREKKKEKK